MGSIFIDLEGFEGIDPIMLRRTLLELVVVRYTVNGACSAPLAQMLADAGLPNDGSVAPVILRAAAQNKAVFIDHPDLYCAHFVSDLKCTEVVIGCDMWLVEKWVSKAGGGDNVYSFDSIPQDIRNKMTKELDNSIDRLRSHLSDIPLNLDQERYTRR